MPRPIEFGVAHGIISNVNPREVGPAAFQGLVNADHFDRIGALAKVPGSTRKSVNAGAAWASLNFYGHFDLERRFQRHAMGLAGGSLHRIESDTTLTPVKHGLVNESLSAINSLDRIHFASQNNEPFKFDGESVTRWGVLAPGEREIVLDPIADQSLYTVSGGTKANVTDFGKGACVSVTKTSIATDTLQLQRTGLSLTVVPYGDTFRVWLYIPLGGLARLRTSAYCAELRVIDSTVGVSIYQKERGDLFEGWNRLSWVASAPTAEGGFGPANLGSIVAFQYRLFFDTPITTGSDFRWFQLHTTEDGAPSPTIAGPGAVTGTVRYRAVFISRYGQRSNAGTWSQPLYAGAVGAGSEVNVEVPISSDPQVVGRRLYRDRDGDAIPRLVGIIGDNATSVFVDNVAPDARDLETPPIAGDAEDDNSVAPRMSQVALYKNYAFGIDAENPFQLNISAPSEIESWPILSRPQFDEHLVAIAQTRLGLTLHTRNPDVTYTMRGDTIADFTFEVTNPVRAAAGRRAAVPIKSLTFYWHDDGPFVDDGDDPWYVGAEIHNRIVSEVDPAGIAEAFLVNDHARLRMVCFLRARGSAFYEKVFVYEYGKRASGVVAPEGGVDPLDVRLGSWMELQLPAGIDPRCAAMIERDADKPELWIGCGDGYVYRLQDPDATAWARGNSAEAVACTVLTGRAPLSDGDRFGRPIWIQVAGRGDEVAAWTVTVSVYADADGPALASETFPIELGGSIGSVRRRIPNSRRLRGAWVDVRLEHAETTPATSIERIAIEPLHDRAVARPS